MDNSNDIIIWDVQTGIIFLTLTGHTAPVSSLKVINNITLASGSYDNNIILWDLSTGSIIYTLIGHDDTVTGLEYLTNGYLVSGVFV